MQKANPAPLGLAGFAFTTWMLSMVNAGWYSAHDLGMVLALAMAYGGTAQLVAGVLEYTAGNTFGMMAFFSYGAFWWSFALFVHFFAAGVSAQYVGWYLLLWGVVTFYLWLGTFDKTRALQFVFLALWVTFVLLAIGDFGVGAIFGTLGGYVGLLTALLAFYCSAAEIVNVSRGKTVLPVGPYQRAADAGVPQVSQNAV